MLPKPSSSVEDLMNGEWTHVKAGLEALQDHTVDGSSVGQFLSAWSDLGQQISEAQNRLFVAATCNTADGVAEEKYQQFVAEVAPALEPIEQSLKEKLLAAEVEPEGFSVPLLKLKTDAKLFNTENHKLETELSQLNLRYNRITGSRTVQWEGEEQTTANLKRHLQAPNRSLRESIWRALEGRNQSDCTEITAIWSKCMALRGRIAKHVGFDNYRDYRWQELYRFDYSPADALSFHRAIEDVAVPAATQLYERRRQALGVDTLRPWDLDVDPMNRPPLVPFEDTETLSKTVDRIFHNLDPILGDYFSQLRAQDLLDLNNRKNKAPIGYCIRFPEVGYPFIFTNAVGIQRDVQTLLHEAGHAFHAFEANQLPYVFQRPVGAEFSEVASMTMEFLGQAFVHEDQGGFYNDEDARRSSLSHLENRLLLWPRVAIIDLFQHWAYANPDLAKSGEACDEKWLELNRRFIPGVDISGLENLVKDGWQSIPHIHNAPFYYLEYGLALLGAVQIWRNSLKDRGHALGEYRKALALGGTVDLPSLYQAAGARFALDHEALEDAISFMMGEIDALS